MQVLLGQHEVRHPLPLLVNSECIIQVVARHYQYYHCSRRISARRSIFSVTPILASLYSTRLQSIRFSCYANCHKYAGMCMRPPEG